MRLVEQNLVILSVANFIEYSLRNLGMSDLMKWLACHNYAYSFFIPFSSLGSFF